MEDDDTLPRLQDIPVRILSDEDYDEDPWEYEVYDESQIRFVDNWEDY